MRYTKFRHLIGPALFMLLRLARTTTAAANMNSRYPENNAVHSICLGRSKVVAINKRAKTIAVTITAVFPVSNQVSSGIW